MGHHICTQLALPVPSVVELELAVAGPEGCSEGFGPRAAPCCHRGVGQRLLMCRHIPWVTCVGSLVSCLFLVTAFEESSPQVRGQLVLVWMVLGQSEG